MRELPVALADCLAGATLFVTRTLALGFLRDVRRDGREGPAAAFARRDEGSFCRRGWGGHAAASLPHSGARNCGHCWTVFRVPEFAVGARGCWAWASSSLRACDPAFCLLLQGYSLRRAYGASRSFQLRRIIPPIHSASRESDQQWPFSREAECG